MSGEPRGPGFFPGRRDGSLRRIDSPPLRLASCYEVLEAQPQPFPPQHTLAQIRRDRLTASVALYRALGGGWNLTDAQWSGQNEAASQQRERWPWMDDAIAQ